MLKFTELKITTKMRNLLFILIICSMSVSGQQMKVTKIDVTIDQKYKVIQSYITEAKTEVRKVMALESIGGDIENKDLINQLLFDLQAIMKVYRPKLMKSTENVIYIDSLNTIIERDYLSNEILRLKREIASGQDSALIQPRINELQNNKNDLNKLIKTWTK